MALQLLQTVSCHGVRKIILFPGTYHPENAEGCCLRHFFVPFNLLLNYCIEFWVKTKKPKWFYSFGDIFSIMETREKILQRTGELFQMMGMKSLTMDFIAADLGISKRTIYELFQDKDKLMLQAIEYLIMESNKRLLELMKETENVIEAIFVMIEVQHQHMKESNPVVMEDLQRYFVRLQTSYYANREKCREFSINYNLLERGMKEGISREDLKIDLVDTFILEMIVMFHSSQALKMMDMTRNEAIDNIFLPYFRGICTPKGVKLIESYTQKSERVNK